MSRRVGRDTLALALGTVLSGVFAYLYFVLATRVLGADRAAPIATLWTYWAASAAILTFPLQHWIIRQLAAPSGEVGVVRTLPRVWSVVVLLSLVASAASWVAREDLFGRRDLLFPLMVGLITLGSSFVGVVRGGLAGRGRMVGTAWVIAGENVVRLLSGVVVSVAAPSEGAFAVALVLGPVVGWTFPGAVRFEGFVGARSGAEGRHSPLAFLGGIASASLIAQVVLTGGPIALAVIGGAPSDVTSLFAALALFRAPYVIALGIVTQLTGVLTRYVLADRRDRLERVRLWTVTATAGAAVVAAGLGGAFGSQVLRVVFGSDVAMTGSVMLALGVGTAAGLGNLVTTLTLVARGRAGPIVASWALSLALAATVGAVATDVALHRVAVGFVVAEVAALCLMLGYESRVLRAGRSARGAGETRVEPWEIVNP